MKKIIALILAAVMLCSCAAALAEKPAMPYKDTFASMYTFTEGNVITITLSKPVDKLYVNWASELKIVELQVTESLNASVYITNQNTQPGVAKVYLDRDWIGTRTDRAFVTLQGQWIVSYNRKGEIVDVSYAGAGDIQAIRDVAFAEFGKPAKGRLILDSKKNK